MSANATNSERECVNTIPENVSVALLKTKLALYTSITLIRELKEKGQDMTAFAPCLDALKKAYNAAANVTTSKRALEEGVDSQERPEAEQPPKKKAKSPEALAEAEKAVTDNSDDSDDSDDADDDTKEDKMYELYMHQRFGEFKLQKVKVPPIYSSDLVKQTLVDGYFINTETDGDLMSAVRALYDNEEIYEYAWVDDEALYLKNVKDNKVLKFSAKDSLSHLVFIHGTSYELIEREREYVKDSNATQPYKEVRFLDGKPTELKEGHCSSFTVIMTSCAW